MRRAVVLVVMAGLLSIPAAASASVTKFDFDNVAFPDGTTGVIYASVKDNHNNSNTYCEFATESGEFLGYYQEPDVVFSQPDQVEQFCLDHFGDRQT